MLQIAADILVYGGSFAGCAAALKAAQNAPDKNVILVSPDPVYGKLGGIGTIGGQNFFDTRKWKGAFPQKGSFEAWRQAAGDFYNVDVMSNEILNDLLLCPNLLILFQYDIEDILICKAKGTFLIKKLVIRQIYRDSCGFVLWDTKCEKISVAGSIFIDASSEGKLVRLSEPAHTVGRYDWPCKYLDCSELINKEMGRQQVATLMIKMTGIKNTHESDMNFATDDFGSMCCWGGNVTYRESPIVKSFNNKYGPFCYALKPVNAAQNGANSKEWWVNALLVFNVDGRALARDKFTWRYPQIMRADYKNVDEAWVDTREFLRTHGSEFLKAIRQYPGFSEVDFVYADCAYPEVGEIMYLRETIHLTKNFNDIRNDTENSNYALISDACIHAGDTCNNGSDAIYYGKRVGLGFYWTDINAYKFEDLKDANGEYVSSVISNIRPDIPTPDITSNPMYIPLAALTSSSVLNLLSSGYPLGVSALGWSELRVIPNLCVTGDAAGIAAAYSLSCGIYPLNFSSVDILNIQQMLINCAYAKLDKI